MIEFRYIYDPDERFKAREKVRQILQGDLVEPNAIKSTEDIEKLLEDAVTAYNDDPTRDNRLKKVMLAAILRDTRYGSRNYRFLKGVGLNSLFVENYKSSDRLDIV